jgi:sporulation protein YhbH
VVDSIFRPFASGDALKSDRTARDRQRHRHKLKEAIRENIADVIADESIIGRDRDKVIKIPIRGVKEYRFVYGDNQGGVGSGQGDTQPGQVVGERQDGQGEPGKAGDQPGVDYYETDVTLDELVDIMFEDLELPDLERRILKDVVADRTVKRRGYRKSGVRVHLDRRRTARARVRRMKARGVEPPEEPADPREGRGLPIHPEYGEKRFPFIEDDLTYKKLIEDTKPESNAVVICIMDTSGSMDSMKKYLARSFFFLLYQFVRTKYERVELVFVAHHSRAKEVTEEEFFYKGESGGTMISSGYHKALEIVRDRYHPQHWNIYAFHCSDGDNFESDNQATLKAAEELCDASNLFGYGEIKPMGSHFYESSMLELFGKLDKPNYQSVLIESKADIWPSFRAFLSREKAESA